jgi:hypothetical protein
MKSKEDKDRLLSNLKELQMKGELLKLLLLSKKLLMKESRLKMLLEKREIKKRS